MPLNAPPPIDHAVSAELIQGITEACGPAFAYSYLSKAVEARGTLLPHTVTAHMRLKQNRAAMAELQRLGVKLVEPLPFGHPARPDSKRMAAE